VDSQYAYDYYTKYICFIVKMTNCDSRMQKTAGKGKRDMYAVADWICVENCMTKTLNSS